MSMSLPLFFTKKLIYTISWEDVTIDQKLLQLDHTSSILTIASAGDHLFNYALEGVSNIHAVDINPIQLHLVELKKLIISAYDFDVFWAFFGVGKVPNYRRYFEGLLPQLTPLARSFWSRKQHLFNPQGRGFYRYGTTGWLSRLLLFSIRRMGVEKSITELIHTDDIEIRQGLFEPLWNRMAQHWSLAWWVHPWVLYLGGIPMSQQKSIGPLLPFLKDTLYTLLVEQKLSKNPYWRLYWDGCYSPNFAPRHLQLHNFLRLKECINHITLGHSSLLDSLNNNGSISYTHVNLLDHQDWLFNNTKGFIELNETWDRLNELPSVTKILFRSSYETAPWVDELVSKKFMVNQMKRNEFREDRVFSYSSTYLITR